MKALTIARVLRIVMPAILVVVLLVVLHVQNSMMLLRSNQFRAAILGIFLRLSAELVHPNISHFKNY